MSELSPTPLATSRRALPFVARTDLIARLAKYGDQQYWVIKDPLSLQHFRLQADQYAVLKLLDGRRTLHDIRNVLVAQFPSFHTTTQQIQQLVTDLFQQGLVWSTRPGQSETLARRHCERRRRRMAAAAQNLLFIRLPGWDPQWILDRCYPVVGWLLHPTAICLGLLLIASCWIQVLHRFEEFHSLMPRWDELWTARYLLPLWFILGAVKVLHEFGHAFACRHFGGECHEMGVAFLVFSPCMYCDVSDASFLPSRWQRMAIGAAGIYVELVLSALAFFTWRYTNAGVLHTIGISIFLVTSISTILFNLNPLLRLDGYYILSDWLQVPNLRDKANRLLERFLQRICLGISPPTDVFLPGRGQCWFALYALAAVIYRWQLVLVICLVLYTTLKPYGLQTVGLLMGTMAALTALVGIISKIARAAHRQWDQMCNSWRPVGSLVATIIALAVFLLVPIPMQVGVPAIVEPHQIRHVYVGTPGRLVKVFVRPGDRVKQGEPLARLENFQRLDQFQQLHTALAVQRVNVTVQQARGDAAQMAMATDALRDLHSEATNLHRQLAGLLVVAPCDGTVIGPPPREESPAIDRGGRLPRWQGSPLQRCNLGAFLEPRTHLLSIAPHDRYQATLLIDPSVRQEFANGRSVSVKIDSLPNVTFHGSIEECAHWIVDDHVQFDSLVLMKQFAAKTNRPADAPSFYEATVLLPKTEPQMAWGMRGWARISVTRRSVASWLWRYVNMTFNFHM